MNHHESMDTGDVGPARFFDMQEVSDEQTLETAVASDRVVESRHRAGRKVRIVELTFTSQHWKGLVWRHPARIYVPDNYDGTGVAGIIGTERQFFEAGDWARRTIPETDLDTEAEYAEGTALDLGMPVMIFANPADCPFGLDESDFTGYALKKVLETQDLTWNGFYPIAKAYLRAITLLHSLDGIRTARAVLLGNSKRGLSVCIAAGADPERVAGVMACGYHGGNNLYHISRKFAEFGADVGGPSEQEWGKRAGPGFQGADALLRTLNNPTGFRMLMHFDPYIWRYQIKSAYLVALGTNDEFFALGTPNSMMTEMSGDKGYLAIDNVRHTWVSEKHLCAWRMWLAHTFLGRSIPGIEARSQVSNGKLEVEAQISTDASPRTVSLFYSHNKPTLDWRGARWDSVPMVQSGEKFVAQTNLTDGKKTAWYVEVCDEGVGGAGYVSSLVEILG
ncbi:PhoPQ-activated protein PqaA family protein [Paraburkholderia sediminicola]|uniref:PhoPQ-activated protein PqaA family protein n=1 Tax=Paraburkholderia sediminicola TaxID=458836 RepID=UPI0038B6EA47